MARASAQLHPEGDFVVHGFASRSAPTPVAVIVTWFMRARGIAFHFFFPIVPRFAASHGLRCAGDHHVAQLIHDNFRVT